MRFRYTANNILKYKFRGSIIIIAAFFIASFLRFSDIEIRPMHVDEAVHALKFGDLLENNYYRYDPVEYHGPALNYITLIPAYITGAENLKEVSESILRVVPAFFGMLCLLFFLFLLKDLTEIFVSAVILLISISPIIVFYNRYYIQESLLVASTFCMIISLYKYFSSGTRIWLLTGGIFAGLMFASKETSIISFVCLIISLATVKYTGGKTELSGKVSLKSILLFLMVFISVAALFYTSFFSNPAGIVDPVRSISNYATKAGNFPDHIYPWHYYFTLIFFRRVGSFFFTEIFILLFFLYGAHSILRRWNNPEYKIFFVKIIFVFTILLTLVYSIIPYKTPWSMISFWSGIIIIAAYGITEAVTHSSKDFKTFLVIFAGIGILHQFWQSYQLSFTYSFHPQNPFVYSQAGGDMKLIEERIKQITGPVPWGDKTFICVAAAKNDYWPLPWYLRSFDNTGWVDKLPEEIYRYPIILTIPDLEEDLLTKLYSSPPPGERNLYIPLFDEYMELRPGIEIRGYIRKDYYDNYLRAKSE